MGELCKCGMPEKWVADSTFPMEFNAKMNEYYVVHGPSQNAKSRMRYCFWCGGELPASKRGTFFTEPSSEELRKVQLLMAQVRDSASMRAVLGEPDFVFPKRTDERSVEQARIYNIEMPNAQYLYQSGWETLSLSLDKHEDGSITYHVAGRPLKDSD